jgi:hypothetical protein
MHVSSTACTACYAPRRALTDPGWDRDDEISPLPPPQWPPSATMNRSPKAGMGASAPRSRAKEPIQRLTEG